MALALAKGMVDQQMVSADQVTGTDPFLEARKAFETAVGCQTVDDPANVLTDADVIFIAVKPDKVEEVLVSLNPHLSSSHLVISIAAGVPLATFEDNLLSGAKVIRVMPNTPAMVGAAAAGYSLGHHATSDDGKLTETLLSAVGIAVQVPWPLNRQP